MNEPRDHADALIEHMLQVHFQNEATPDLHDEILQKAQEAGAAVNPHEDRLLHTLLGEVLNEQSLPDQTDIILQRVEQQESQAQGPAKRKVHKRRKRRSKTPIYFQPAYISAAALILICFIWIMTSSSEQVPQSTAERHVVADGQDQQAEKQSNDVADPTPKTFNALTQTETPAPMHENEQRLANNTAQEVIPEPTPLGQVPEVMPEPEIEQENPEELTEQTNITQDDPEEETPEVENESIDEPETLIELAHLNIDANIENMAGKVQVANDGSKRAVYEHQALALGDHIQTAKGFLKIRIADAYVYVQQQTSFTISELRVNNELSICLVLDKGEVYIEDGETDIAVITDHALIKPIGTKYAVRQGSSTLTSVIEGSVEVQGQEKKSPKIASKLKRVQKQNYMWSQQSMQVDAGAALSSKKTAKQHRLKKAEETRILAWKNYIDQSTNLIANGNFEQAIDSFGVWPAGTVKRQQGKSPSGQYFAVISMEKKEGIKDKAKIKVVDIPVTAGVKYLYTAYLKSGPICRDGVKLEVVTKDWEGNAIGGMTIPLLNRAARDWQRVEKELVFPKKVESIDIYVQLLAHDKIKTTCSIDLMSLRQSK